MVDELLRRGLQRLQERFSTAVEAGHQLECCLIERPAMGGDYQAPPPEFLGRNPVAFDSGIYRPPGVVCDKDGCPTLSDTPTCDLDGKPIANSAGQPYAFDRGACRAVHLYGTLEARDALKPLLADAGNLLDSISPDAFPVAIPSATLRTDNALPRWLYCLFDLAWAEVAGSPLRVSKNKSAWHGHTSIALGTVMAWRGPNRPPRFADVEEMLANIPDPAPWYSAIADVAQSSVYALDILLTMIPGSQDAVGNGKATDSKTLATESDEAEGTGEKRRRGAPTKKTTQQRADFAKPLVERGLTWSEIFDKYSKTKDGKADNEANADAMRLAYGRAYPAQ